MYETPRLNIPYHANDGNFSQTELSVLCEVAYCAFTRRIIIEFDQFSVNLFPPSIFQENTEVTKYRSKSFDQKHT